MNKTSTFKLENIKHLDDGGSFSGYASVFGVQDSDGDVIVKGAFQESIDKFKESGKMPKMLWQHNPTEIIGKYSEIYEDDKGLFVRGSLILGVEKGREAYELLKAGVLDAMSVGFNIKNAFADDRRNRVIDNADLWEISLVTWGSNPQALISDVKSIKTERDFERTLRKLGFSQKEAKRITAEGFKSSTTETVVDDQRDVDLKTLNAIDELTKYLRS